jgi:cyclic di-GMP phosphodiesterase Gmr
VESRRSAVRPLYVYSYRRRNGHHRRDDKWVIQSSVAQAAQWRDAGKDLAIALNLSPKDLKDRSVVRYLIQAIENVSLDPSLIEVELTERGLFENEEMMLQLLGTLKKLGVKIALDDFGTGYNSLVDLVLIRSIILRSTKCSSITSPVTITGY